MRATNFDEVCLGYTEEEAMKEASRCLNCKNPKCRSGCPVSIDIPAFIAEVKEGNFAKAAEIIAKLRRFLLCAAVYVLRRHSVRVSVF